MAGTHRSPLAIDLFAGAGGLTEGFRSAGFKVVQAIERDVPAATTYTANHPDVDILRADIRALSPQACLQRLGLRPGQVHIIICGPPCQGFSESNRRTRTLANPRNHLYREILRFVTHIDPQWVVLENVAGLKTLARGEILERIVSDLAIAGYRVSWCILNAARHGVPQVRRRLFVIANRTDAPIPCNSSAKLPNSVPTVRDAISDLPVLPNGASTDTLAYARPPQSDFQRLMRRDTGAVVSANFVTKNAPHVQRRYRHIPEGGNWENIPSRLLANYTDANRCHTGIYHRLRWDRPAKVIGNFRKNMLVHPSEDRGLSVREAARLQSFPDHYSFVGSIGFRQQQVADAVPPILAASVAQEIYSALELPGVHIDNIGCQSLNGVTHSKRANGLLTGHPPLKQANGAAS